MNLSPEEKALGRENYERSLAALDAMGLTRRDFLKAGALAVAVPTAGMGAFYFGYSKINDPVRVGVIGTGDEGSVLISNINPDYIKVEAICDIRPYNQHRAFHGDQSSPGAFAARQGLMKKYGWTSEDEAKKHVKVYTDYKELLKDPSIEAVIIATPLVWHAQMAIDAMNAGKHVLTEKLMAHSIKECKDMGRKAKESDLVLAVGHQRHYSVLYDNAVQMIKNGLIGDIHHIRAQWHRNNLPGKDSWQPPMPKELLEKIRELQDKLAKAKDAKDRDRYAKQIEIWTLQAADESVKAENYGYQEIEFNGRKRTALEELLRWRLWNRTGGGLMAELGSHQLDAASIFISAMNKDGHKTRPLTVTGVGGRHIFPADREADDHVYCSYEFPSPLYHEDPNKKVVVTYSSINGNGFGDWGEIVMGTAGTLILEREQETMLYSTAGTSTSVGVKAGSGGSVALAAETGAAGPAAKGGAAGGDSGPVSRGYTEEMEHWAYCIRHRDPKNLPRCHPEVAMADAIIALTSNLAMKHRVQIEFQKEWFDIDSDRVPETEVKSVSKAV